MFQYIHILQNEGLEDFYESSKHFIPYTQTFLNSIFYPRFFFSFLLFFVNFFLGTFLSTSTIILWQKLWRARMGQHDQLSYPIYLGKLFFEFGFVNFDQDSGCQNYQYYHSFKFDGYYKQKYTQKCLLGNFNFKDINWKSWTTKPSKSLMHQAKRIF